LVVALRAVAGRSTRLDQTPPRHLLYIEEPEAHLFPSAQSLLVQGLVSMSREGKGQRLLLTTHSPYVLAKINNLIKAGGLEATLDDAKHPALSRIVPKRARIAPGDAHAYAIVDGELRSIIDEDGLIAADYLDDVSGQIGAEFSRLLQLEIEA
jgi:AAA ATPase domain